MDKSVSTYTFKDICEIFDLTGESLTVAIKSGNFPFPVIKIGKAHYFPCKPIEEWLEGRRPTNIDIVGRENHRHKKNIKKRNAVNYNYPIPTPLSDQFDEICRNINKNLTIQLKKGDFVIVAIQEFIARRPEHLDDPSDPEENA